MPPQEILKYEYDESTDVITIEGIKYSGDFFRMFNGPSDRKYRLEVNGEGVMNLVPCD